jgi:hypothetical protein
MTGDPFKIERWSDAGVVAEAPALPHAAETHRCGCTVVAECIEGAIPRRVWCAACVLAQKLGAFE